MKSIFRSILLLIFSSSVWATSIEAYYPEEAAEKCISGYVVLKFKVHANELEVLEVIESEPAGTFEEAAKKNLSLNKASYINENKEGSVVIDKFRFEMADDCEPKS